MTLTPLPDGILPDVVLYGRPGCHLCEDARSILEALLAARRDAGLVAPRLVERDITSDPTWERAFLETIPVVELAGRRLLLATSRQRLAALLDETLGRPPTAAAS